MVCGSRGAGLACSAPTPPAMTADRQRGRGEGLLHRLVSFWRGRPRRRSVLWGRRILQRGRCRSTGDARTALVLELLHLFGELGHRLEEVGNETVVGDLENGRFRV